MKPVGGSLHKNLLDSPFELTSKMIQLVWTKLEGRRLTVLMWPVNSQTLLKMQIQEHVESLKNFEFKYDWEHGCWWLFEKNNLET